MPELKRFSHWGSLAAWTDRIDGSKELSTEDMTKWDPLWTLRVCTVSEDTVTILLSILVNDTLMDVWEITLRRLAYFGKKSTDKNQYSNLNLKQKWGNKKG